MLLSLAALLGCAHCGDGALPEIEVHGATDRLSFDEWRWASERRRQLVAEMDYEGGRIHDVIIIFYDGDERITADGIPGHTFDEPGTYKRRFPITQQTASGEKGVSDATRLVIHVNESEQDARRVAREHGLVPQGTEAPEARGR